MIKKEVLEKVCEKIFEEKVKQLDDEYAELARENERDSLLLDDLKRHPKAYERVARERYFMKAPNEDVFVLSDE